MVCEECKWTNGNTKAGSKWKRQEIEGQSLPWKGGDERACMSMYCVMCRNIFMFDNERVYVQFVVLHAKTM